jgi:hypothetical protein
MSLFIALNWNGELYTKTGLFCMIFMWKINYELSKRRALWAAWYVLDSCLANFLTLVMEAVCPSQMLVNFHQITQRNIPEDRILQPPQILQNKRHNKTVATYSDQKYSEFLFKTYVTAGDYDTEQILVIHCIKLFRNLFVCK